MLVVVNVLIVFVDIEFMWILFLLRFLVKYFMLVFSVVLVMFMIL